MGVLKEIQHSSEGWSEEKRATTRHLKHITRRLATKARLSTMNSLEKFATKLIFTVVENFNDVNFTHLPACFSVQDGKTFHASAY